jgi:hypothetical protein
MNDFTKGGWLLVIGIIGVSVGWQICLFNSIGGCPWYQRWLALAGVIAFIGSLVFFLIGSFKKLKI